MSKAEETQLPPRRPCEDPAVFEVRLVDMDYVMRRPVEHLDPVASPTTGRRATRVPVLRVFGPTPAGQKACLHLHGALPHFFFPAPWGPPSARPPGDGAAAAAEGVAAGLEGALERHSHLRQGAAGRSDGGAAVYEVAVVTRRPFYGYTPMDRDFFRVTLFAPALLQPAADLLRAGEVTGAAEQPYESHISYRMRVMIDHNLFGMDFVGLSAATFRRPLPSAAAASRAGVCRSQGTPPSLARPDGAAATGEPGVRVGEGPRVWTARTTPGHMLASLAVRRATWCELELDATVAQLTNGRGAARLPAGLSPIAHGSTGWRAGERRLVRSLASMWEQERRRLGALGREPAATPAASPPRAEPPQDANDLRLSHLLAGAVARDATPAAAAAAAEAAAVAESPSSQPSPLSALLQLAACESAAATGRDDALDDLVGMLSATPGGTPRFSQGSGEAAARDDTPVRVQNLGSELDGAARAATKEEEGEEEGGEDGGEAHGAADSDDNDDEKGDDAWRDILEASQSVAVPQGDGPPGESSSRWHLHEVVHRRAVRGGEDEFYVEVRRRAAGGRGARESKCVYVRRSRLERMGVAAARLRDAPLVEAAARAPPVVAADTDAGLGRRPSLVLVPATPVATAGAAEGRAPDSASSGGVSPTIGGKRPRSPPPSAGADGAPVSRFSPGSVGGRQKSRRTGGSTPESDGTECSSAERDRFPPPSWFTGGGESDEDESDDEVVPATPSESDEGEERGEEGEEGGNDVAIAASPDTDTGTEPSGTGSSGRGVPPGQRSRSLDRSPPRAGGARVLLWGPRPPSASEALRTMASEHGLPLIAYSGPFFSNPAHVPLPREQLDFNGRRWAVPGPPDSVRWIRPFPAPAVAVPGGPRARRPPRGPVLLTPGERPPGLGDVQQWLAREREEARAEAAAAAGASASTPAAARRGTSLDSRGRETVVSSGATPSRSPVTPSGAPAAKSGFASPPLRVPSNPAAESASFDDASTPARRTPALDTPRTFDGRAARAAAAARRAAAASRPSPALSRVSPGAGAGGGSGSGGVSPVVFGRAAAPAPDTAAFRHLNQNLTQVAVEVHACGPCGGVAAAAAAAAAVAADPARDPVCLIVLVVVQDGAAEPPAHGGGAWALHPAHALVLCADGYAPPLEAAARSMPAHTRVWSFASEAELLDAFVDAVRSLDPDVLLAYEAQQSSLGYLADRGSSLPGGPRDLLRELGRDSWAPVPPPPLFDGSSTAKRGAASSSTTSSSSSSSSSYASAVEAARAATTDAERSRLKAAAYRRRKGADLAVSGRLVLSVWRIMRSELKLQIYNLETVLMHVAGARVPQYPRATLSAWAAGLESPAGSPRQRSWRPVLRLVGYVAQRARAYMHALDHLNLVGRTSELARTFGVRFEDVLARGSQFRVESIMARMTTSLGYLLISPSRAQVAGQPAMESVPLVMEPLSAYYTSPVVVLDFRSLYPSMVIAYNLCYSTCLGRVDVAGAGGVGGVGGGGGGGGDTALGVTSLHVPGGLLAGLEEHLWVAPNGCVFVRPSARQGVVPQMLHEILQTRFMVKRAMRDPVVAGDRGLGRMLNARQFGLKMVANVTYGYTAASFSGRMPCAELADAIVETGRRTLERTIAAVESNREWNARVVYGDTDSIFVELPGRSRRDAFRVGAEIAARVTEQNPRPVLLEMEKVYHPCLLVSKKRYVGYCYESPDQARPTFDAKGIETVRRDGCPAVSKQLEASVRLLFSTNDLSAVRDYLERQWRRMLAGKAGVRDFVFSKAVKLGTYSGRGPPPPAAVVGLRAAERRERAEPLYGERVPYVVVEGTPDARLVDLVVSPEELLRSGGALRLNARYYITKQIVPALARLLGLAGANVAGWFAAMPRPRPRSGPAAGGAIRAYYGSRLCTVCGGRAGAAGGAGRAAKVCDECAGTAAGAQSSALVLLGRRRRREEEAAALRRVCVACAGSLVAEEDPTVRAGSSATAASGCRSLACPVMYDRRGCEARAAEFAAQASAVADW